MTLRLAFSGIHRQPLASLASVFFIGHAKSGSKQRSAQGADITAFAVTDIKVLLSRVGRNPVRVTRAMLAADPVFWKMYTPSPKL